MIKGITVILLDQVQTGVDGFNHPVYAESETPVKDVLVYPATSEDVISELNLSGKHLEYYLCVPKGDNHEWTDRTVRFSPRTGTCSACPKDGSTQTTRRGGTGGTSVRGTTNDRKEAA